MLTLNAMLRLITATTSVCQPSRTNNPAAAAGLSLQLLRSSSASARRVDRPSFWGSSFQHVATSAVRNTAVTLVPIHPCNVDEANWKRWQFKFEFIHFDKASSNWWTAFQERPTARVETPLKPGNTSNLPVEFRLQATTDLTFPEQRKRRF